MRWLAHILLGYVALALQLGLADLLTIRDATPNFPLLAAVFMCATMPRNPALLGAFLVGLGQDLLTQNPPGLYALAYGLTALIATAAQQVVSREHPLAQLTLTGLGGSITACVLTASALIHPSAHRSLGADVVWPALLSAIYSALLAPGLFWLLGRIRPLRRERRAWN